MRNIVLWGSIVGLIIVGVAVWMLLRVTPEEIETIDSGLATSTETVDESEAPVTGMGKMTELLALSQDLECAVAYTDPETTTSSEGTMFIAGGNIRADFVVTSADVDEQVLTSLINNGTMFYSWTEIDGEQIGMKLDSAAVTTTDGPTQQTGVTTDTTVSYDCKPWVMVDNSVFVPPTSVSFTDLGDFMNVQMEQGTIYETE